MSFAEMPQVGSTSVAEAAAEPAEPFDVGALRILARLRKAFERAIHTVSKEGLRNSRDLQQFLPVDRNLSWQVFKMLGPVDTLSTLPYVPAAISMSKMEDALTQRGTAPGIVGELASAFAAFESFVRQTAGDRDRFETMVLSATNSVEAHQIDLQHRRSAFKAHSHFFGVEVDAVVNTLIFQPVAGGQKYDCVSLLDLIRMRRLRLDTDVAIHGVRYTKEVDEAVKDFDTFDEGASKFFNAPLIPEFCTSPVPSLETVTEPSGMVRTYLKNREIGVGADLDLAMGRIWRAVPLSEDGTGNDCFCMIVEVTRPTKLLVVDMMVSRSLRPAIARSVGTYANAPREKPTLQLEREGVRMPMRESFDRVGYGIDVCRVREVPSYPDLLVHAVGKMGWSIDDFDLYRIRVEYPLMDTTLVLRLSLLPGPTDGVGPA